MLEPGAVAALAAGSLGRLVAGSYGIEVRVPAEGIRDVRMAALADLTAHELFLSRQLILSAA